MAELAQDGSGRRLRPALPCRTLIFRDGFEDGTLDAWSASATDGGDLSVSALGGMKFTTAGLRAWSTTRPASTCRTDRREDEGRYRARFYFDPNGFDPGEAQGHLRTRIFIAFSEAPTRRLAAIVLRRQQGQFAIRGAGAWTTTRRPTRRSSRSRDGPHLIEFELGGRRAGRADGYLALAIDGVWWSYVPLDNSLSAVDFVRMGALSVKPGASGEMYWDEFESRRPLEPIGP